MGNTAKRSEGFIHTVLTGKVGCRAYGIGPAVRLGNVTIIVGSRWAGLPIARAAMFFEAVAPHLAPTRQNRNLPRHANKFAAVIEFNGGQRVGDLELTPMGLSSDRFGQASLTIGNVRITVRDRDAAEHVAKALAEAYSEAEHVYPRLKPLAEVRVTTDRPAPTIIDRRLHRA